MRRYLSLNRLKHVFATWEPTILHDIVYGVDNLCAGNLGGSSRKSVIRFYQIGLAVLLLTFLYATHAFAQEETLPPLETDNSVAPARFLQIEEIPELPLLKLGPELDLGLIPDKPNGDSEKKRWFDKMSITGYAQFRYNQTM